jgi:TolB-like protein
MKFASPKTRVVATLLLLGFLSAGAGCGYKLAGQGSILPNHISALLIVPFENQTQRPEIEQFVTEQVALEFTRRGKYKVVSSRADADAIVEGAVTEYRTAPVQFTDELLANRVEAIVRVQATVRDLATDEVLWSQGGLIFKEQYEVPQGEDFLAEENLALEQIARGVAQALVTSILEGF